MIQKLLPVKLDIENIQFAYQTTGKKPVAGYFFHDEYACPLGVLFLANGGNNNDTLAEIWAVKQFGRDYTKGFMAGFDGDYNQKRNNNYIEGYENGAKIAKELGVGGDSCIF